MFGECARGVFRGCVGGVTVLDVAPPNTSLSGSRGETTQQATAYSLHHIFLCTTLLFVTLGGFYLEISIDYQV